MPQKRPHLGRYPKYKDLRDSTTIINNWRDHHILPSESDLTKVDWLCDNCDTLAKHKGWCTKSHQEQAKQRTKHRWAEVVEEAMARVVVVAKEQVRLARASRDAAAAEATSEAASSPSGNGRILPSMMQDADEEIAEEQLLYETAEKELRVARRAAAAASAACAQFDDEAGDDDEDGGSNTDDDDDDNDSDGCESEEDTEARVSWPVVVARIDADDTEYAWLKQHISTRKLKLPTQHSTGIPLRESAGALNSWRIAFPNFREYLPLPSVLNSTPLQLTLSDATLCWFDPGIFFRDIWDPRWLKCPKCKMCGCNARPIKRLGFDSSWRVCVKLDGTIEIVLVARWQHIGCEKKNDAYKSVVFSALHPDVYAQFPTPVQSKYGFVARTRGVLVRTNTVRAINSFVGSGTTPAAIARMHSDAVQNTLMEAELMQRELNKANQAVEAQRTDILQAQAQQAPGPLPIGVCQLFANSIFAHKLSPKRIRALYREDSKRTQPWFLAYNGSFGAKIESLDHTFKAPKCVQLVLPGGRYVLYVAFLCIHVMS
jgi:hypothetical protein